MLKFSARLKSTARKPLRIRTSADLKVKRPNREKSCGVFRIEIERATRVRSYLAVAPMLPEPAVKQVARAAVLSIPFEGNGFIF